MPTGDHRCPYCGAWNVTWDHQCHGRMTFTPYAPTPPEHVVGAKPVKHLTEDDVRRIIREELERYITRRRI